MIANLDDWKLKQTKLQRVDFSELGLTWGKASRQASATIVAIIYWFGKL